MEFLRIIVLFLRLISADVEMELYEDGSFVLVGCVNGALCDERVVPHRTYILPTMKVVITPD